MKTTLFFSLRKLAPALGLVCLLITVLSVSTTVSAKTLRDKNGEIMRGTRMVLGKPYAPGSRTPTVENTLDLNEWLYLKELGFNSVRVVWIDPFVKDDPNWNFPGSWWEVDEVLPYLDLAVENATQSGMNIIINYHNVGEYVQQEGHMDELADFGEMAEFWQKVAPRYADNDLVYYELNNEQTWNSADYYKDEFISTMQTVYEQVRADAPERTVIMFSFNNIAQPMKDIADTYTFIDWNYTAVGFHFYGWVTNTEASEIASLETLLGSEYPTICTEWGYDYEADYYKAYLGYPINAQALEQYGQSWFDWRDWSVTSLAQITDVLIPDAKAKGYYWVGSASSSSSSSSNSSSSSSSSSSESQVCTTGCDWYGRVYPLCEHHQTGWHWVNSQSCIGVETCENQWGDGGLAAICHSAGSSHSTSSSSLPYSSSSTNSSSSVSSFSENTQSPAWKCELSNLNQWSGGITAEFKLTNIGGPINSWGVAVHFSPQVQVTNVWGSAIGASNSTPQGTSLSINNAPWNGQLENGDSVTFGILGKTDAPIAEPLCVQKSD